MTGRYIPMYSFGWHVLDLRTNRYVSKNYNKDKKFVQHLSDAFNSNNKTVIARFYIEPSN